MSITQINPQMVIDAEAEQEPEAPRVKEMEIDVHFQKKHFTRLVLKEPNGKQLLKAEQYLTNQPSPGSLRKYQIELIAAVARVPVEVVEEMPYSQLEEAFAFLGELLSRSPPTGGT